MKAEEYLKEMSKEIHNREVRDCIIQEYRDHLEDAIEALLVKGMSEVEAGGRSGSANGRSGSGRKRYGTPVQ